jgi:hypothetical protein
VHGIVSKGNVTNSHVNLACGDPRTQSNISYGIQAVHSTGIETTGNIDSCSVHAIYDQHVIGMRSLSGGITNVRLSSFGRHDLTYCGDVVVCKSDANYDELFKIKNNDSIKRIKNVYAFNIIGNQITCVQAIYCISTDLYMLDTVGKINPSVSISLGVVPCNSYNNNNNNNKMVAIPLTTMTHLILLKPSWNGFSGD